MRRVIINFMYPENLFNMKEGFEELLGVFNLEPSILRLVPNYQSACFNILNNIFKMSHQADVMLPSIYELMLQTNFTEFLWTLYQVQNENLYLYQRDDSSITHKISEVCSYIHTNYSKPLSLESLARTFFISSCYLSRQFKQVTGFRLTEYIQNVRIINAQFLLASTEESVSSIAMSCGFTSFSQFNRVFHQKANCSPTEYRRSHGHSHWA